MKEQCGGSMTHFKDLLQIGTRRPKTAVWKIPSNDVRRENFSKSAPGCGILSNQQLVTPRLSSRSSLLTGQPSFSSHQNYTLSSCPECSTLSRMQLSPDGSQATFVIHGSTSLVTPSLQSSDNNLENGTPTSIPSGSVLYATESGTRVPPGGKLPHIPSSHHSLQHPRLSAMDGSLPSASSLQRLSLSSQPSAKSSVHSEQSLTDMKSPWYITVLKEKERFLLTLGEEVTRLSKVESEIVNKDQVIAELQQEIHRLKSHMLHTMADEAPREKRRSIGPRKDEECKVDAAEGESQSERSSHGDIGDSVPDLSHRLSQYQPSLERSSEEHLPSWSESSEGEHEALLNLSQEASEIQSSSSRPSTGGGDTVTESSGKGTQTEKDQVLAELESLQELSQQMSSELEKVKTDYELCTGVISSLQKHCFLQESQLRNAESEHIKLQKEHKERGLQLEAMSTKFSNLREERKHEEMLAAMQKEKFTLQQCIQELTSELEMRNSIIGVQKSELHSFYAQEGTTHHLLTTTQTDREAAQSKIDDLEFTVSQLKVALEFTNSKFERFRSKIVQSTYSTPGTKSPQGELTDDELLEALQKVMVDRSNFHTLLTENGIEMNPLSLSEMPLTPTISKLAPTPAVSKLAHTPGISKAAPTTAISKAAASPAMTKATPTPTTPRTAGSKKKGTLA